MPSITDPSDLVDIITENWGMPIEMILDPDILPSMKPEDWPLPLIASLADLSMISKVDENSGTSPEFMRARDTLTELCTRRVEDEGYDADGTVQLMDVELVIERLGGRREKEKKKEKERERTPAPAHTGAQQHRRPGITTRQQPQLSTQDAQNVLARSTASPQDIVAASSRLSVAAGVPTPTPEPRRTASEPRTRPQNNSLETTTRQEQDAQQQQHPRRIAPLPRRVVRAREYRNLKNELEGKMALMEGKVAQMEAKMAHLEVTGIKRKMFEIEDEVEDEEHEAKKVRTE